MLLCGAASVATTAGMGLPFGTRTPTPDGWLNLRDDLFARALVMDDSFRQYAVVAVDLFTIGADLVRAAAQQVWEEVRLVPQRLFVVPTGTQTAPLTDILPGLPPRSPEYAAFIVDQLAAAVIYAARCRVPAGLGWAAGPEGGAVLRVDNSDGEPIALAAELPAAPAGTGQVLSADYPGQMVATLARLAPRLHCLPLQGATAGTGRPDLDGERLGALAWAARADAECDFGARLAIATTTVSLPLEAPPAELAMLQLEAAENAVLDCGDDVERRWLEGQRDLARQAFAVAQAGEAPERTVELSCFRAGNGAFLASPLVLSPALAARVREVSAYGPLTLTAAAVNGWIGVLTCGDARLPECETWPAALPFAPEAAERYLAAVSQLTAQVREAGA